MTLRKRLQHAARHPVYGVRDPRLDSEPDIPGVVLDLWLWFWELDSGRQSGMSSNPLSWGDIKDWAELTGVNLTPWEVSVIKAMDRAYLTTANEMGKAQ